MVLIFFLATEAVEGDVAANLALLLPFVNEKASRPEWFNQINDWKKRLPFAYEKETSDGLIKPQSVIEKLSNLTQDMKERTVITTGVGQHQMWTAQYVHFGAITPCTYYLEQTRLTAKFTPTQALPLALSEDDDHLWRSRNNGVWPTCGHRCQSSSSRCSCHRYCTYLSLFGIQLELLEQEDDYFPPETCSTTLLPI